jgi:site-specific DNA recombinase
MRAAIYARISRDADGDGLGVARQVDDCRAHCALRGWQVVAEYVDNDVSAYSGRVRPSYQRLLADLTSGRVDLVVAWAPERLHRSPRELEDFLELIERQGVGVETVKAGVWDVSTSHGRLVARMLGAVSRAESERMGERVSRAHQQAKASGYWRGPIPFGMRASKSPGCPEPDPEQAPIVEEIFERVSRGDALTQIASDLNRKGVSPRRGAAWTHTGVLRLTGSPCLAGLVEVDGEFRPGAFDGVVSADAWRTARASIARRPRGERRRPRETLTLLGGILCCAEHDQRCFGASADYGGPTYAALAPGRCHVTIKRAAADLVATEAIIGRLKAVDARDLLTPARDDSTLEDEIHDLVRRREELAELVGEGLLTAGSARPKLAALADRLQSLERARTPGPLDRAALIDPVQAWERWTMPQRRDVVRLLFEEVTVRHVGFVNGPRADGTRVGLVWAEATPDLPMADSTEKR